MSWEQRIAEAEREKLELDKLIDFCRGQLGIKRRGRRPGFSPKKNATKSPGAAKKKGATTTGKRRGRPPKNAPVE